MVTSDFIIQRENLMRHRIRAAGILVDQGRILMVNENERGLSYWVPPGGGFEAKDGNTHNTVKREVWEETGLSVTVGNLLFVREFCETFRAIYHVEQFYIVDHWSGEVSLKNLEAIGEEARYISQARWFTKQELSQVDVFPPQLKDVLWDKLDRGDFSIVHLGYS
jgi:8-oxo-dGTP diphosphatase